MDKTKVPAFHEMMRELFQAVKELDGSGTVHEIDRRTIEILDLPQEVREVMHGKTSKTEVEYRLAWMKTYLKFVGLLANPRRSVWALTEEGWKAEEINPGEIVKAVHRMKSRRPRKTSKVDGGSV